MKPHRDSKCGVCATPQFERNNYFYGKQFTVRDLQQEQSYFNDKRHLINRMVLGWGVVCGLHVEWKDEKKKLAVEPGMAIDCCGHEIVVCETQYLSFDRDDDDCCLDERQTPEGKFVLCLEYDECHAEPVDLPAAGCDEKGKTEHSRIRDGFKLRLKSWDEACPKEPPEDPSCPDHYKHDAKEGLSDPPNCNTPDLHHYLCDKLKKCHECESCDCVILATLEFPPARRDNYDQNARQQSDYQQEPLDSYQPPQYEKPPEGYGKEPQGYKKRPQGYGSEPPRYQPPNVDECTNRKLVYNNSLLYDLIYCQHGGLPHIVDFSWRERTYPSREIGIKTFLEMMRGGLTVYFDQPMVSDSLNRHTFIVAYLLRDTGTGAFVENRIPFQEIRTDPTGDCYSATFVATDRWINKELDADDSELMASLPNLEAGVDIEITLRGSRIWSENGKALDGDYLADKLPTGNGTQGGDFVDWFRVMPEDTTKRSKGKSYKEEF